jgi:hypothetical protein
MHWSRLIELPLALIMLLLQPIVGQAYAEMAAGTLVPLGCFGLVAFMLGRIAAYFGGRSAGTVAIVMTMVSPAISMQLRPMRIDHHGWQLVCAALAYWTLFWPSARKAGISMGLALAFWLHISLEGAPAAAVFFALLGWRWAISGENGARLGWTVATFFVGSLGLFFATQQAGLSASEYCDSISPAHIWAISAAALVMVPAALFLPQGRGVRIAAAIAAGAAAGAMLYSLAPMCTKGAFATMDPVVRDYWYIRVSEGMPIWHQKWGIALSLLGVPLVALASFAVLYRKAASDRRADMAKVAVLLVYAFILAMLVFRTISTATLFAVPVVAIGIAALYTNYRQAKAPVRRVGMVALMILMLMPGTFIAQAVPLIAPAAAKEAADVRVAEAKAEAGCESIAAVSQLAKLKDANIVAPFDMGPAILLTTPHSVVASSHHRNEKGMRAHIDIYRLTPAQSRAIVQRRKVTHIVACLGEAEMRGYEKRNPDGLWAQLAKGNTPDWLEPLPDMGEGLKVWRVR